MKYLGNYQFGGIVTGSFNTRDKNGVPITLAGSPALHVYQGTDVSEFNSGLTLTIDFDGRTGHHVFTIDTSADVVFLFANDFRVVITSGTVDGISVVGTEVACFSIGNNRRAVLADGSLTATSIGTGAITAAKFAAGAIDAAAIASNAITDAKIASNAITAAKIATDAITDTKIASNAITAAKIATGALTSAKFAAGAFDAVWTVAARTLTAISDSSGVTTLLSRVVGTIATGTHNPQSGDSFARLGAPSGASISADIQTRLPTSGYTAPPTAAANATAVWANATRTITGGTITTVSDKTGYSLSQAFPANFAALGINASGHVSRVTLVDTTTTNTDMRGTNNALLAASYVAPANSDIAAIKAVTDTVNAQLADIPTVAELNTVADDLKVHVNNASQI